MEDSPSKKRKVTSWYWKYVSEQIDFEFTEKVNCNYCDWKGVRQNILNHFKKNYKNIFFEETQNSNGEHHIPMTKEQRTNFLHHAIAWQISNMQLYSVFENVRLVKTFQCLNNSVQFITHQTVDKYWVFQKGMYSLIGGKLAKASSARKNSKIN
jgi:hypothetical protein